MGDVKFTGMSVGTNTLSTDNGLIVWFLVGPAVSYSGFDQPTRLPPPLLGQHTHEVLKSLGYDEDTILMLKQSGVVQIANT